MSKEIGGEIVTEKPGKRPKGSERTFGNKRTMDKRKIKKKLKDAEDASET